MFQTLVTVVGILQTIVDSIPIVSVIDNALGIFGFGNVLADILIFLRPIFS